ncbi:paraplegin [Chelonus insularis]|uniref:paraplegin n=1 Tax=Chelonus insularis TaxID=460826 RepID=UPI00158BA1BF|nr:paraplegin [Chelonus insularis]XP_034947541.1 paraplegin [Chelonus insularis]XP_034947542.1 paraplegin [Chelonus insularis]XP_034947543.1 paraplegin [Chelonus insularis]
MQNLSKYYCRYLFLSRRFVSSIIHNEFKQKKVINNQFLDLLNQPPTAHLFPLSQAAFNKILKRYSILHSLLTRRRAPDKKNQNKILNQLFCTSSSKNGRSNSGETGDSGKGPDKTPNNKDVIAAAMKLAISVLILNILLTYIATSKHSLEDSSHFISWNEFVHQMLAKGEVKELIVRPEANWVTIILHDGAIINRKRADFRAYQMLVADATRLEEKLREAEAALGIKPGHGVSITYERPSSGWSSIFTVLFLLWFFLLLRHSKTSGGSFMDMMPGSEFKRAKFTLIDPLTGGKGKGVKFSDVAGLKEAKVEVMEFVDYLKQPARYKILGAKIPKGALLLGPPGCGKTMLAKAVATEAHVPFLSMNGSEFIELIGGVGATRVRDLFKQAKMRAPSILYIDEIDAIGKRRSGTEAGEFGSTGESEQTLNQLLVEMDGMANLDGVVVLASTNRAEVLDKALLRPGRFDRHILLDLPTLEERKEIFESHLRFIVLEKKPNVYSARLAQLTPGFSGADIANVVNEAALHAARHKKKFVDASDLSYAIDRVLCGPEKKVHGVSPAEKKIVAYHEAGHALVAWMLEHTDALLKVTIKPRTRGMLGFAQYNPIERKNFSKEQLFEMMCVALGGRVAESIIFNTVTTGAQNDLERVTKIAYSQVRQFGMSDKVGLISFSEEETGHDTKKPYSKKLAALMDTEAKLMVADAYKATEKLLKENRDKLEKVAQALLKKETLTYEEVESLIGPPPFGNKAKVEFLEIDGPAKIGNVTEITASP